MDVETIIIEVRIASFFKEVNAALGGRELLASWAHPIHICHYRKHSPLR
tara:strand:- start:12 stop:158 length:147 start_codon:yes stop_codon:yes gene_type:complete